MKVAQFNEIPNPEAMAALLSCCDCQRWASEVISQRPFDNLQAFSDAARQAWQGMGEADILEAFSAHPRIGDLDALRNRFSRASAEQGQVREADEQLLDKLKRLNDDYEARHGFIFIVCASGKSAQEMCELLEQRLGNTRDRELENGAREQGKILALRMQSRFSE